MNPSPCGNIGFTCAYTPLPLIAAAGFRPFRILPLSTAPDRAGRYLHDNLCPHVKRVLDRALDGDLPPLAGMIVVNSCDAMRRLADAWQQIRPGQPVFVMDLPATRDEAAVAFYATELERLAVTLGKWGAAAPGAEAIGAAVDQFNRICAYLQTLHQKMAHGQLDGGRARLQALYNQVSTLAPDESIVALEKELTRAGATDTPEGVPVYLFGNLMVDPDVWGLIETSGVRVVGDDFCTGSRLYNPIAMSGGDPFADLAQGLMHRPPCARTFAPDQPGALADHVVTGAKACRARGVIGHTLKFCDPYLARLPLVRDALRAAGLPLLMLEGDGTLGSIGQQRTRIEAFIEMLR
jgi:benzoyl-CoA reductase/2-hydroxyglutaryl-CoA dehydratase subunit BcrC/BadD/HgdB